MTEPLSSSKLVIQYYERTKAASQKHWASILAEPREDTIEADERQETKALIERTAASLQEQAQTQPASNQPHANLPLPDPPKLSQKRPISPDDAGDDSDESIATMVKRARNGREEQYVLVQVKQKKSPRRPRASSTGSGLLTPPKSPKTQKRSSRSNATILYKRPLGPDLRLTQAEKDMVDEDPVYPANGEPDHPAVLYRWWIPGTAGGLTSSGEFVARRFLSTWPIIRPPPPTKEVWTDMRKCTAFQIFRRCSYMI